MKEMLQLFRNKVYARFLANILERLGSMIAGVSLMFYLLDQYGKQPVYATMTQIMMALPALIFFLVGTVVDRFDRQRICTVSNICCNSNFALLRDDYTCLHIFIFGKCMYTIFLSIRTVDDTGVLNQTNTVQQQV